MTKPAYFFRLLCVAPLCAVAFFGCPAPGEGKCKEKTPSLYVGKGGNQVKHGKDWRCHSNGRWRSAGEWKDGKKEGHWVSWKSRGQKYTEGNYIAGIGKETVWGDDGRKTSETYFLGGKRHGKETNWYYDQDNIRVLGQKSEIHYKDGEYHGQETRWYKNGRKKAENFFENGRGEGTWTEWYQNGQKKRERNYTDDEYHGKETSWYQNGGKKAESFYENGQGDGTWTEWYDNGQRKQQQSYWKGEMVGHIGRWFDDGRQAN